MRKYLERLHLKSRSRKAFLKASKNIESLRPRGRRVQAEGTATARVPCETELGVLQGSEKSPCAWNLGREGRVKPPEVIKEGAWILD